MIHDTLVLSHYQVAPLLQARLENLPKLTISGDLGRTTITAQLDAGGICFPGEVRLTWEDAEKIVKSENSCFAKQEGGWFKVQTFSEYTNRPYSLYPTRSAPTMLVAGFPMHRIKESDPYRDTLEKVNSIAPLSGTVLDTATGLGYTAIEAAKSAQQVITIELDPAAQEICRHNPWSRELFENSKIEQRIGDSFELVPTFAPNSFDRIIHDPPTMSLAGELYSGEFYLELYRVLKRGGKMFHYIGDPASKSGANMTRGVMERLKGAGFGRVIKRENAFGVVAMK